MHDWSVDTAAGIEALDAELVAPGLLHELRQPLTGAAAAAVLIERALGDRILALDEWRLLRAQLARLAEIVNEYEDLLRPGEAEPSAFEVGPVVSRAVDLLAHRVRPLARRFCFEREEREREGFGAPGALVHAATNLISNALDAIEGMHGDPRIEVRILPASSGGVEVRVSDEGAGIPAEHRDHIFEPRFTTKGPGRGSGLGLHVALSLMSLYGGTVFLVPDTDPARVHWAVTEFCIAVPAPPRGGAA